MPAKQTPSLSHLNRDGEAHMVDISGKDDTQRLAVATASVSLSQQAMQQLVEGNNKKGDVLSVARIAGIQAAKRCSELIPLCHPLLLNKIDIDFEVDAPNGLINIRSRCGVSGKTGVEMEALTAASVAALTIYDMCKAVDKGIVISEIQLLEKQGGKSGHWQR